MTHEQLTRAGEALRAGEDWRRPLARLLGPHHPNGLEVDPRMVSRWASGQMDIPGWVDEAVVRIAREAADELQAVADEIEAGLNPRP